MSASPYVVPRSLGLLALVAFGLIVGLLGANSFAEAIGMADVTTLEGSDLTLGIVLRIILGSVLVFASIVFAAVAVVGAAWLLERMERSPRRPGLAISIVMISLGAAFVVVSFIFYWWLAGTTTTVRPEAAESSLSITLDSPLGRGWLEYAGQGGVETQRGTSAATHLVGLGTFFAGLTMLGVGVWGSMGRRPGSPQ